MAQGAKLCTLLPRNFTNCGSYYYGQMLKEQIFFQCYFGQLGNKNILVAQKKLDICQFILGGNLPIRHETEIFGHFDREEMKFRS